MYTVQFMIVLYSFAFYSDAYSLMGNLGDIVLRDSLPQEGKR